MVDEIVLVEKVSKKYVDIVALNSISFEVKRGELFGIIGPDGAGKTTLFRILATLLKPDKGKVIVLNFDVIKEYKKIRSNIGYIPGRFSLYRDLTVEENINFFATIFGTSLEKNYHLIKDIYSILEPFKKRKANDLSGGMKQKLALCCALIHKPKLLILDEPTTGIDPVSRNDFWNILKNLKKEGITILVSTPYMNEAKLCDKIILIQKGCILDINTPSGIISNYSETIFSVSSANLFKLSLLLNKLESAKSVQLFGNEIHYIDKDKSLQVEKLKSIIINLDPKSFFDVKIKKVSPDIEDCFIALMK
ncbi:MAG: ABC transporter ATP-binding protein [Ignavibacteria bacterium]|nr:ABC transporter ATP-binding protein [Ignavibacteria bacterium]